MLEHLERHRVGLVMGRTRQNADWRGSAVAASSSGATGTATADGAA